MDILPMGCFRDVLLRKYSSDSSNLDSVMALVGDSSEVEGNFRTCGMFFPLKMRFLGSNKRVG
jgi:hypothetical protein